MSGKRVLDLDKNNLETQFDKPVLLSLEKVER